MASAAKYLEQSARLIMTIDGAALSPLLTLLNTMRAEQTGAVWILGNGGSQANASHLALHLREQGIRGHDLLAETAHVTALSNDYDYVKVAAKTIRNLGSASDILIVITGSGDSPNVVLALVEAKRIGMQTFGLLGFFGGQAVTLCDQYVLVASSDYGCVEDAHSALIHAINAELGPQRA